MGLARQKQIDHTRDQQASRLAEIRAKVMRCIATVILNHQDPLCQTTRVAAQLFARFLLTAQGGGVQPILIWGRLGMEGLVKTSER